MFIRKKWKAAKAWHFPSFLNHVLFLVVALYGVLMSQTVNVKLLLLPTSLLESFWIVRNVCICDGVNSVTHLQLTRRDLHQALKWSFFFFFLQKYLNGFRSWHPLKFEWLWLGGKKLWLGPFFFSPFLISCWLGSNFLCATHIIPVKNEEGVVIMFILNFDYILNEASSDSLERLSQTSPSKADQCEYNSHFIYAIIIQ